nr:translation initiation factor IF-2 N-terminal domain-containing protein [Solirubrobacterales bacterium]
MPKKRVHEIAKSEGIPSKQIIAALQKAGLDVKASASSVDEEVVLRVLRTGSAEDPAAAKARPEAESKAKAAATEAANGASSSAGQANGQGRPVRPVRPAEGEAAPSGAAGSRKRRRVV